MIEIYFIQFYSKKNRQPSLSFQGKQRANNCKMHEKSTRIVRVGWKHKFPKEAAFMNMTEKRGGGSHRFELEKNTSLDELQDKLLDFFFAGGVNGTARISRDDLTLHTVANFSECPLPRQIDGEDFNLERYCKKVSSTPVRVYLLTEGPGIDEVSC